MSGKFTQKQINDAMAALVEGDEEPWRRVMEGIRAGQVEVAYGGTSLTIRPVRAAAELGLLLTGMRKAAGEPGMDEMAEGISVSVATISRLLNGQTAANWPTIRYLVEWLGGDVEAARTVWMATRQR